MRLGPTVFRVESKKKVQIFIDNNVTTLYSYILIFHFQHKYGWRFQKRPGLDMFMHQIGYPNFEVVIYTIENGMTFFPIIDGIDPQNQFINYR